MRSRIVLLVSIFAAVALAQTAEPQFEVASVKPSPPTVDDWQKIGVHIDGAMVRCTYLSLRDYIGMAYNMKPDQISGPDWISRVKYDISAKLPDGAPRSQVAKMMQAVLAERFKLVFHREPKEFPVYVLGLGKGPLKLKESADDPSLPARNNDINVAVSGTSSGQTQGSYVDLGGGSSVTSTAGTLVAKRVTIASLINSIDRYLDRPLIDETGLTGTYDITLQYSLEELRNVLRSSGSPRTIPDSAAEQFPGSLTESFRALGLKLEPRKAPLDVLIVDRAEKTPVEN